MKKWPPIFRHFCENFALRSGDLIAHFIAERPERFDISSIPDSFLIGLVDGLLKRGVPQRVVADMFGISARTLQRQLQKSRESSNAGRLTNWSQILKIVNEEPSTREQILGQMHHADPYVVNSSIHDMIVNKQLVEHDGKLESIPTEQLTPEQKKTLIDGVRELEPQMTRQEVASFVGVQIEDEMWTSHENDADVEADNPVFRRAFLDGTFGLLNNPAGVSCDLYMFDCSDLQQHEEIYESARSKFRELGELLKSSSDERETRTYMVMFKTPTDTI